MKRAKGKPGRYGWRAWCLLAIMLLTAVVGQIAYDTGREPVVQRVSIRLGGEPGLEGSVKIVLLADIHVAGPDMPPARLARIVAQVAALEPDLILFAGDFVSDKRLATRHYSVESAIAPLRSLPIDTPKIAVLGNHDHWRDAEAVEMALKRADIAVLRNRAIKAGGLTMGGLDDDFIHRADLAAVLDQMRVLNGPKLVLSHSPDPFPDLPSGSGAMLAGHTHCGQIAWPWGGSPATKSRYGQRYACGVVRENGNALVTSAGLGTSVLPFRLFTAPEIWVIELN